jgi:two-component system, sensor histidine kinase and response regulator
MQGLLEQVFRASTLGILVYRLDDETIVEANETFCYLVGRGAGELLGTPASTLGLFGSIGARRAGEFLRTRGMIDGFDATIVTPADEMRILRMWAEVVSVRAEPLVVIRASDIDGRASAGSRYLELREAEVRYRALVESIPVIAYTEVEDPTSPTGSTVLYTSPQSTPILGYTPEDWQMDPSLWIGTIHPDDRDRVVEEDLRAARDRRSFASEYRVIARDGHIVWFRDEASLVEDPTSGVSLWQGIMLDITEEHRLSERSAESEAKYRNLVEHLPAVVYLGEYGTQGDWLYISPRLEEVLGYTPEEWLAHPAPMGTFTHPDDLPGVRAAEEESLATGRPFHAEYRMHAKDGHWVWLVDEASPVRDPSGKPLFMQGFMYDISERKAAEERLIEIDQLKNTLLHTLSHDLKEPLTVIVGAASTLERLDRELSDEDREELLRTLATRARGMNTLLTDLLDMDRLDRGIIEPRRFPVDLGALVTGLVARTELLDGRRVDLDAPRCVVNADATKIERVVENLLSNAVRYTPAGSPIRLRVEPVDGGAVLVVDDEGPGVPDDQKETIFEPFRRGPGSADVAGSGIGLSLVARFAELHGGRAWVEDRRGGGASFRVLIPGATPTR